MKQEDTMDMMQGEGGAAQARREKITRMDEEVLPVEPNSHNTQGPTIMKFTAYRHQICRCPAFVPVICTKIHTR